MVRTSPLTTNTCQLLSTTKPRAPHLLISSTAPPQPLRQRVETPVSREASGLPVVMQRACHKSRGLNPKSFLATRLCLSDILNTYIRAPETLVSRAGQVLPSRSL